MSRNGMKKRIKAVMTGMLCSIAFLPLIALAEESSSDYDTMKADAEEIVIEVESLDEDITEEPLYLTEIEEDALIEAADVETALSDMTLSESVESDAIYGWWGTLIIAVLGGTGYILYQMFFRKKIHKKLDRAN